MRSGTWQSQIKFDSPFLADQLKLSQQEGADCTRDGTPKITTCLPSFRYLASYSPVTKLNISKSTIESNPITVWLL